MKIAFFGSSDFAAPILNILKKNFDVVASFTSPEQKIETEKLKTLKPDLFVVASFGKILKKEILDIPNYGAINIHPSLLPKYRGASPIQTAILNGDKKTGVTIIKMDEEMDHGPIIFQKEEKILDFDTGENVYEKLFKIGSKHLYQAIKQYTENQVLTPQDDSRATFTSLLKKADGFVDMEKPPPPERIKRMIRAYFPWPGVFFKTNLNGKEKIIKLLPSEKIQVEGKKPMSYKDFANGYLQGEKILEKLNLI